MEAVSIESDRKFLLFCLLVASLFILTSVYFRFEFGTPVYGNDHLSHLMMARGQGKPSDSIYPLFYRTLSAPFSFSPNTYYAFSILFLCVVLPFFLYFLLDRDWLVSLFVFSTGMVFLTELGGAYPQAVMGVMLIVLLLKRNIWFRLFLLMFAFFVHDKGFYLLACAWLVSDAWLFVLPKLRFLSLGFFGFFDEIKVRGFASVGNRSFGDLARFFSKGFNVLLVPFAVLGFVKEGRTDFVAVALVLLVAGFLIHSRVWWIVCLLGVVGLRFFVKHFPGWRFRVGGLCVFLLVFNSWWWLSAKLVALEEILA